MGNLVEYTTPATAEQIEAAIRKNMPEGHGLKLQVLMSRVRQDLQAQGVYLPGGRWDKAAKKLLNVNKRNHAELKSPE